MPVIRVACSRCGAGLTFGATPVPGTRVQCPRCATVITLNGPPLPIAPVEVVQLHATVRTGEMPSPRSAPATEEEGSAVKWVALAAAGFLLLGGVSIGLAAFFAFGKRGPQADDSPARVSQVHRMPSVAEADSEPGPARPLAWPPRDPPRAPNGRPPNPPGDPFRPGPLDPPGNAAPPPLTSLPEAEQRKVDQAIERGVSYLRGTQSPSGGWFGSHRIGYAALPGLTLLECGVAPNDPAVERAAALVRLGLPHLTGTYELALSILFLDRLGDPNDRPLIQALALRLVAGQNGDGGWGYNCPLLSPNDHDLLLTALRETRPESALELFVGPEGQRPPFVPTDRPPAIGEDFLPVVIQQQAGTPPRPAPAPQPLTRKPDPKKPDKGKPKVPAALPPALQDIPALHNKLEFRAPQSRSDNSNTQFAALALWAARRHEVPMERTLALLEKRFRTGQNPDGGWGYMSGGAARSGSTPPMTCSGLLGLALGHGVLQELQARAGAAGRPVSAVGNVQDQGIRQGVEYLSRHVGVPDENGGADLPRGLNLYYLWSLERVGVLFNLKTIGGKDWYRWGAQVLVVRQNANGSWHGGAYHGSSLTMDTCFALLFLKRANLARDLTEKLEFLVEVKP